MLKCNCEDFPCCDCGQEYMAQIRYEAVYGNERPYDPDDYLNYDDEEDEEDQ